MRLRLIFDSVIFITVLAVATSPHLTPVSVILALAGMGYLIIEGRAIEREMEEWDG